MSFGDFRFYPAAVLLLAVVALMQRIFKKWGGGIAANN